jgi:hypothetical protein
MRHPADSAGKVPQRFSGAKLDDPSRRSDAVNRYFSA